MISKSKKAAIRSAAIKAFKDGITAITAQGDNAQNVLGTMLSFKNPAIKNVCSNGEETAYFETCYVYGSQRRAYDFAKWAQNYWATVQG